LIKLTQSHFIPHIHMQRAKLTRTFWLLALCLTALSCRDPERVALPQGIVTEAGVPVLDLSGGLVGNAGGSITSVDGRITLAIPPGALPDPTEISISPISNYAPLGVGNGYRLLPRGLRLQKPAVLTYHYVQEETDGGLPESLGFALQHPDGIWKAQGGVLVDRTQNTASVGIGQLGDWSVFQVALILPRQQALLPGGRLRLKVWQLPGSQRITSLAAGSSVPLGKPEEVAANSVMGWLLNGDNNYSSGAAGTITRQTDGITYTAPPEAPDQNPVALGADVRLGGSVKQLITNITIGGVTKIRLNGGPFNNQQIVFTRCVGEISSGGNLTVLTAENGTAQMQIFYPWYNPGVFAFNDQAGICGVSINLEKTSGASENFLRSSTLRQINQTVRPASGSVRVSSYGEIGGLITGTISGSVWYFTPASVPVFVEVTGQFSGRRVL
jgi:hypothetical protein